MTFELIPFLKDMLSAPGLSGYERPIRDIISKAWEPLSDELSLSNLGSLLALKRGEGPEPRPTVMIAVHMDAIGLMVTAIEDGFLRFTQVGGVDPRILPGQPVIVHATNSEPKDLPGGNAPGAVASQRGRHRTACPGLFAGGYRFARQGR